MRFYKCFMLNSKHRTDRKKKKKKKIQDKNQVFQNNAVESL